MQQPFEFHNYVDGDGNPAGGDASATGISITWQNGPLGRGEERKEPNGAFVETVLAIAAERLKFYQNSRFACTENEQALQKVEAAIASLKNRTARREQAGVEGEHGVMHGEAGFVMPEDGQAIR